MIREFVWCMLKRICRLALNAKGRWGIKNQFSNESGEQTSSVCVHEVIKFHCVMCEWELHQVDKRWRREFCFVSVVPSGFEIVYLVPPPLVGNQLLLFEPNCLLIVRQCLHVMMNDRSLKHFWMNIPVKFYFTRAANFIAAHQWLKSSSSRTFYQDFGLDHLNNKF